MSFSCGNCNSLLSSPGHQRCPYCGAYFKGYKLRKAFATLFFIVFFSLLIGGGLAAIAERYFNDTVVKVLFGIGVILGTALAIFLARKMD